MISPKILLAIISAVALLGVVLLAFQYWIVGGIIVAISGGLLYLWWRMNQLLNISNALMKNDLDSARRHLAAVKRPEKLNPYSKTYYYFFEGMVHIQSNAFKEARQSFKTALDTNHFRGVDERATALLMLAQLDLRNRNTEGAKRYIREAKGLEPSQQIREQISTIVKQARLRV